MSFMDPLGFSSYAISPAYPMQSMVQPQMGVDPFAAIDPMMSPFGAMDPMMSSFAAVDPMMSPFGSFNPGLSSFGGMQPNHYMPYPPYPRPSYPPYGGGGDPSGGLSGMMGQLIQLFMSLFAGQNEPELPPEEEVPGGEHIPGDEEAPEEEEVDNREQKIERLDPDEKYSDALEVLSVYSKDLGAKGGYLTKDALEDFIDFGAKEKGVPDKVKKAAEIVKENDALYNLLCLQSESDPDSGFALSSLDTQWEDDLEIDNLQASPSSLSRAADTLVEHKDLIGKLNKSDSDSAKITRKDLEALALGESTIRELSDSESRKLQAAALKILADDDAFEELDTFKAVDSGTGPDTVDGNADDWVYTYDNTKDKSFDITTLAKWYEKNDD